MSKSKKKNSEPVIETSVVTPVDPFVMGKASEEELLAVRESKAKQNNFLIECGKLDLDISALDQQKQALEARKLSYLAEVRKLELDGRKILDDIRKQFDIQDGEHWQFLPDGTVKKVDPAMVKAMEEAQRAAAAAAQQQNKAEAAAPPQ